VRLKKKRGADNIFDFTLGNPEVEPLVQTPEAMRRIVERGLPGRHGYMPNPCLPEVRAAMAARFHRDSGLEIKAEQSA
jgi:aspartate aminotransferase